jgi:Mrp family chromosome partitioning ATPase
MPPQAQLPSFRSPEPATLTVGFRPFPTPSPPLPPAAERFADDLVVFHRPDHPVSGQYRELWKSLAAALPATRSGALLLTAATAGAGTTTALLNLAVSAARDGKRQAVVVDADLRRPGIAQRLGLPPVPGLQEVLAGTVSLQRALRETGQANLHALTAGQGAGLTGGRLAGEAMRSVLRHLRSRFDLVLVDAMPWDGRPDVVSLGCACDAISLVVRQADASKPEVAELFQIIPEQGGRLCGCILTQL